MISPQLRTITTRKGGFGVAVIGVAAVIIVTLVAFIRITSTSNGHSINSMSQSINTSGYWLTGIQYSGTSG